MNNSNNSNKNNIDDSFALKHKFKLQSPDTEYVKIDSLCTLFLKVLLD